MTLFYPLLQSINIIELSRRCIFPISDHCVISVTFGNAMQHFHTLPKIPGYRFPLSFYFSGFPFLFSVLVFFLSEGAGSGALSREIEIFFHLYFYCLRSVPGEGPVVASKSTYLHIH